MDVFGDRGDLRASLAFGSTVTGTISYAAGQGLFFNAADQDTVNFCASYSQALVWSRYLTDTELQALIADPYGWYSPRRETIGISSPYPLLAGGSSLQEVSSGQEQ
jgi:hypothetical protein